MTHDVEKRYDRPGTFHAAAVYVGAVVAVAGIVFAVYALTARESVVAASLVPAILFGGGVGAFVKDLPGVEGRGGVAGLAGRRLVPAGSDAGVPVDSRRRHPGDLGIRREDAKAPTSGLFRDFCVCSRS